MRSERSDARRSKVGPLTLPVLLAVLLHALALGAAATVGFKVATRVDDAPETIALTLASPWEVSAALFTPELAPEPAFDSLLPDFVLPDVVLPDAALEEHETVEPEFVPPDLLASLPPPEELVLENEIPVPVVFERPDLRQLDFGDLDRVAPGAAEAGMGAAGVSAGSVAALGSGGAVGNGPGGNGAGGPGTGVAGNGTGSGQGASLAVAPRAPVIREPKPVDVPSPSYPKLSRRAGEEGSVLCRLHLSLAGFVTAVDVLESSGFARLDDAAREKLAHWRFEPRLVDGRAVESTLLHRVTFRLDG